MYSYRSVALPLLLCLLLSGCAGLWRDYQKPQVNITSLALAPESSAQLPVFNIGIQVVNPNRSALSLEGISYSLEVEGHRILSGARAELPHIPGYGMADFTIQARPDLFGSVRLFGDLFSRRRASLGFRFKARLDVGGLMPFVNLEEVGRFSLPAVQR